MAKPIFIALATLAAPGALAATPAMAQHHGHHDRGHYDHGDHGGRHDRRYDHGDRYRHNDRGGWHAYREHNRHRFDRGHWRAPFRYHRFRSGIRIAPLYYGPRYYIGDPGYYRLPPAGPYRRWVRHYDDVMLVDVRTGVVLRVYRDFFW
ncbi:MAG: RcnB family protein [Sphingomonas sp.]